ncbi:MAG TPA: DUF2550 domain-containing protein [Pseudonocardiaceae bacterium]
MGITEAVGLVVLVLVLVIVLLAWRRVRLVRRGGIDVALRSRPDREASRWHLGIARYQGEEFVWYRVTSLRKGPNTVVRRGDLTIAGRRSPTGSEAYAMPSGATVLCCQGGDDGPFEIAMTADALTGFLSWLESAPPGRQVPWAS